MDLDKPIFTKLTFEIRIGTTINDLSKNDAWPLFLKNLPTINYKLGNQYLEIRTLYVVNNTYIIHNALHNICR